MYIHMCVMCVYIDICHMYVYTYVCVLCMHRCIYIYIYISTHIYLYIHIYIYIYISRRAGEHLLGLDHLRHPRPARWTGPRRAGDPNAGLNKVVAARSSLSMYVCVCIYIYIYISLSLTLSLSLYMYICIYICICTHIYTYTNKLIRISGGAACLTLLVQHMFSSKVVDKAANSTSRIRQATP